MVADTPLTKPPLPDIRAKIYAPMREALAKAMYDLNPFEEGGEYVDGFQVLKGGKLSWEEAKARDAEFAPEHMPSITEDAYKAADVALAIFFDDSIIKRRDAAVPDDIRAKGWSVAVHNDYQQSGMAFTFWLFTKDGRAVKGEGRNDAVALDQVREAIKAW